MYRQVMNAASHGCNQFDLTRLKLALADPGGQVSMRALARALEVR